MKSLKEQPMKASKALVFDIKRFAVHDGHGLRTTVFFKGSPPSLSMVPKSRRFRDNKTSALF